MSPQVSLGLAIALGGVAMWLMLPRGRDWGRVPGALLGLASLGWFAWQMPRLGDTASQSVFLALAGVTVIASVATVTFRSPVYCAIWFGLSLLGTAGLFLFQGAQFLGVATIVVYAGAILVTFLFVLMLAHPTGHAYYDRLSWEALLSAATGAVMVGILSSAMASVFDAQPDGEVGQPPIARTTQPDRAANILSDQHVARIGAELFSRQLIALEVAGTLLLIALVGCVAIVSHARTLDLHGGGPGDG